VGRTQRGCSSSNNCCSPSRIHLIWRSSPCNSRTNTYVRRRFVPFTNVPSLSATMCGWIMATMRSMSTLGTPKIVHRLLPQVRVRRPLRDTRPLVDVTDVRVGYATHHIGPLIERPSLVVNTMTMRW
jgi:hypothetical protein